MRPYLTRHKVKNANLRKIKHRKHAVDQTSSKQTKGYEGSEEHKYEVANTDCPVERITQNNFYNIYDFTSNQQEDRSLESEFVA